MEKDFDKKVRKFNIAHKRNKLWYKLVTYLSAFVVFWTTYILILPAITLDRNTYEAGSSNAFAVSGPLAARVITRQEIMDLAAQGETFVWFARIGEQYYALGSDGGAVPVNVSGTLEAGAILTYDSDDTDNISFEIDRINGNGSVTGDITVTIKNVKTGQHLYTPSGNIFTDADNAWETMSLHYVSNVAEGNNINTDLASVLYNWSSGILGCSGNEFKNMTLNYLTAPRTEQEVLYCAIVDDSIVVEPEEPDPDPDPEPDPEPDPDPDPEPDPDPDPDPDEPYTPYYIAFNPGNGNGVDGDYDTEGSMFDYGGTEGIQRNVIDVGKFINENGEVIINFPDDSQLGTEKIIIDKDNTKYIIAKEKSYNYKLKGWYNITTGEYIDVSNGPTSKTIKVVENGNQINNVFYADWVAADYNLGEEKEGTQYNAEDTNSFITTKVFDYNELFNLLSASLQQTEVSQESWTDTGNLSNTGISSFILQNLHTSGSIGNPSELKDWNKIATDATTVGKWGINNTDNNLLKKLFDETGNTLGVTYLGKGNYLYHKVTDENGNEYYEYDSVKNAATYNQSEQRFYVWDNALNVQTSGNSQTAFLPFNEQQLNETDAYIEGDYNYWFGIANEMKLTLPDNVGTTQNKTNQAVQSNSETTTDMTFNFSGDDDYWIFIDDQLVVDGGGLHDTISSEINFSTGEISVTNSNGENLTSTRAKTSVLSNLQAGEHTVEIYYLERNGQDSNYKLRFNLANETTEEPEEPEEPGTAVVNVTKEWDNVEGITIPEKVAVTLYNGDKEVETIELNAENNWSYTWSNLPDSGEYSVKEEELEEYRAQYETVYGVSAVVENNAWVETRVLEPNEYIITNSDLNYDDTPKSEGFVAMDDEFNSKELTISNGVIDSSEITNNIIWIVIAKEDGYVLQNKETKKYIQFGNDYQLYTVDSIDEADIFYNETETKGIRVHVQRYGNQISLIYDNNMFQMRVNGNTDFHDYICVRLYASGEATQVDSQDFKITNTYKAPVIIKKVDSDSKTPLEGVKFTITNSEGKYYTPSGWVTEEATIETDSTGIAKILKLDDGTYTLNEIETKPGYNKVNNPITFTVTNGKITLLNGNLVYLDEEDDKQLTMCIENVKGYILPDTGGQGTINYQIFGIAIMIISIFLLKSKQFQKENDEKTVQ